MRATPPARPHRITRSDGGSDPLTRQQFNSYDAAYDALEKYYGDFCCSDDDRIDYTITALPDPAGGPEP
jgi:hypothetical protein